STDMGFRETGILTARVTLPEFRFDGVTKRLAFFDQLQARIRAIPGVTGVGSAGGIPFSGWNLQATFSVFGRQPGKNDEGNSHWQGVYPEFFKVMGIPLVRGRMLTEADRDTVAPNVVVNELFAKHFFPGEDPLGKRVKFGDLKSREPWVTIVGVIRDYRHYRLPDPMDPAVYYHYAASAGRSQTLVVRTDLPDPYALAPALRA